jgi:hypothetical protein
VNEVKEFKEMQDVEEQSVILDSSFVGRGFNRDILNSIVVGFSP